MPYGRPSREAVPHLLPLLPRYLGGFTLAVTCASCAEVRVVRIEELAAAPGDTVPLGDLVGSLRCSTCGAAPSDVRLRARGELVGVALLD